MMADYNLANNFLVPLVVVGVVDIAHISWRVWI
jgi:hypothetical protein